VDVAFKFYFVDFHDIAVPLYGNMNLVCDLPFCGSDK
jgi:hypothetical protein